MNHEKLSDVLGIPSYIYTKHTDATWVALTEKAISTTVEADKKLRTLD